MCAPVVPRLARSPAKCARRATDRPERWLARGALASAPQDDRAHASGGLCAPRVGRPYRSQPARRFQHCFLPEARRQAALGRPLAPRRRPSAKRQPAGQQWQSRMPLLQPPESSRESQSGLYPLLLMAMLPLLRGDERLNRAASRTGFPVLVANDPLHRARGLCGQNQSGYA